MRNLDSVSADVSMYGYVQWTFKLNAHFCHVAEDFFNG